MPDNTITFNFPTPATLSETGGKTTIQGEYEVIDVYFPEPDVGLFGESGIYVMPPDEDQDGEALFVTHREIERAER